VTLAAERQRRTARRTRSELGLLPARRGAEEARVARRAPSQPARFGTERSRLGADFIAAQQLA